MSDTAEEMNIYQVPECVGLVHIFLKFLLSSDEYVSTCHKRSVGWPRPVRGLSDAAHLPDVGDVLRPADPGHLLPRDRGPAPPGSQRGAAECFGDDGGVQESQVTRAEEDGW